MAPEQPKIRVLHIMFVLSWSNLCFSFGISSKSSLQIGFSGFGEVLNKLDFKFVDLLLGSLIIFNQSFPFCIDLLEFYIFDYS